MSEKEEDTPETMTFREKAIASGRNYTVSDVPPLSTCILLGIQHYLTMLGATVSRFFFRSFVCLLVACLLALGKMREKRKGNSACLFGFFWYNRRCYSSSSLSPSLSPSSSLERNHSVCCGLCFCGMYSPPFSPIATAAFLNNDNDYRCWCP